MMPSRRTSNVPATGSILPDLIGDMNRLFENDFFGNRFMPGQLMQNVPATNIRETEKEYQIEVAAPGLNKEDFHVDVQNRMLIISAEKKVEKNEGDENFTRREYNFSSFQRSFRLPETVREEDIDASYKNGVLMLTIPKVEETGKQKRRQINIK